MKIAPVILFIILFLTSSENFAQSQKHGLTFASFDSLKDRRTGMTLFPVTSPVFKDDFSLSFEILLPYSNTARINYGYIFRVIFDDNKNIDFIYSPQTRNSKTFSLINENQQTSISFDYDIDYLNENWANCKVHFMLSEDKISLQLKDSIYYCKNLGFNKRSDVKIFFGACFETNYTTTDVPAMMIRDVKIEQRSKLKYHWPLNEASGDYAKDIIKNEQAKVFNPIWSKYDYINWKNVGSINSTGFAKIIENKRDDIVYFLGQKRLIKFDLKSELLDTIALNGDSLNLIPNNQAIFNNEQIILFNPNSRLIIKINPITGEVKKGSSNLSTRRYYLHHNSYCDRVNIMLYVYNGYGHHVYNNNLLQYNITDNTWKEIAGKGNIYEPRYLAASAYLNDTLYVLGGYGSLTGNQELNPRYFYDLNTISLNDFSYDKKWDYAQPENDFCFANSLIIDSKTRDFYALKFSKRTYNSSLQLIKGSLNNNRFENVGNQIEYKFNDINSYADIILRKDLGKLYAFTLFSEKYEKSIIQIYSINYTPIAEDVDPVEHKSNLLLYLLIIAGLVLATIVFLIVRKKKTGTKEIEENNSALSLFNFTSKNKDNAIYFFGGFQVINKDGNDITKKFSRLLKELFLLVLFNSVADSKGISSEKLVEHLWFDKGMKSGRNNLSANVAKLKEILKELDGCELSHDTGYWRLKVDSKIIFVEYLGIYNLLELKGSSISKETLRYLLDSVSKGKFLLNAEYEWLDYHKGQVSDKIIDILVNFAETLNMKKESALIIEIADCLFNFDVVNEEAMILKCKTQSFLGKHSISKKTYENFCKEYHLIYGESFPKSFRSVINEELT